MTWVVNESPNGISLNILVANLGTPECFSRTFSSLETYRFRENSAASCHTIKNEAPYISTGVLQRVRGVSFSIKNTVFLRQDPTQAISKLGNIFKLVHSLSSIYITP